jgi:hypothetical protein
MRLTIIPADKFISIDNVGYYNVVIPAIAENIHAVQWYGTYGIVEIKDVSTGRMVNNIEITDISEFNFAIEAWQAASIAAQELIVQEQIRLEQEKAEQEAREQESLEQFLQQITNLQQ